MSVVAFVASAAFAALPATAHAHGPTPAVLAIAASSDSTVTALQLTNGLALRESDGFRYVCPALWGNDNSWPTAALPDQPLIVAASSGFFLVDALGHVTQHPDPSAQRSGVGFTLTQSQLFALEVDDTGTSITRVTTDRVTPLWSDREIWQSIASGSDFIVLMRHDMVGQNSVLRTVKLSLSGALLAQYATPIAWAQPYVSARVAGDVLYAVIGTDEGFALGRVNVDASAAEPTGTSWQELATARTSIAGPMLHGNGQRYVGLDGTLQVFDGQQLRMLDANATISCLGRNDVRSYACTRDGVHELLDSGLGAAVFLLEELKAPDLSGLATDMSQRCDLQWQHLTFDLLSYGIPIRMDDTTTSVAMDASVPQDAQTAAVMEPVDAGIAEKPAIPSASHMTGGCSVVSLDASLNLGDLTALGGCVAWAGWYRARRRKRH